ncbi:MAG TPA: GNAT family N-acetyltransferase [Thermoanaerobaculia bacterium]|nr:GNAT family N-acetyltransferase [Thermoanaerobaculia bacterium]
MQPAGESPDRSEAVAVRRARRTDRSFVLETARRLSDFDLPSWRSAAEIVGGEVRTLEAFFRQPPPGSELLVAEAGGKAAGFALLETGRDYFDRREHAHLGILAVSGESEGLGVGGALVAAAEEWARARGLDRLTLNVFERNARARRLYERSGFAPETLRYRKKIVRDPKPARKEVP